MQEKALHEMSGHRLPSSETHVLCRQRRNLAATLSDNDDVIGTLETLTGLVMHLLALFTYMAIFGVNVQHLLISLSSISVASAFVFGNSLRTLYESVVFLFVTRPYQVRTSRHCAAVYCGVLGRAQSNMLQRKMPDGCECYDSMALLLSRRWETRSCTKV
jgi:hypothetical protein